MRKVTDSPPLYSCRHLSAHVDHMRWQVCLLFALDLLAAFWPADPASLLPCASCVVCLVFGVLCVVPVGRAAVAAVGLVTRSAGARQQHLPQHAALGSTLTPPQEHPTPQCPHSSRVRESTSQRCDTVRITSPRHTGTHTYCSNYCMRRTQKACDEVEWNPDGLRST
jgi:hypothetical protein